MAGKKLVMIFGCMIGLLVLARVSGISLFIHQNKDRAYIQNAFEMFRDAEATEKDPVMRRIEEEAAKRRIEPVDAIVDRVWKLIPGYNGIEVDIDKTYQLTRSKNGEGEIRFVYRAIPPKIKTDSLLPNPIYKGNPNKPMVSLMVNVAWGNEYIEPILRIMDDENVKATFFFDGSWLKKNIDTAKMIQERGHELENHAYSHKDMSKLSREQAVQEIVKTKKLLEEELNVQNRWFAPPSGDFDMETVQIAHELGLKTVLWTLDTVDWNNPSPESVVQKISRHVEPGSLILMHPTKSSSQALLGMIREIKRKGYSLGTVSQTLSEERTPPDTLPPNLFPMVSSPNAG
ncbi:MULTISPECIES: polysaccharide deacetylase family protein [unclassified Paenibacillus]|uniref:polysaccharide deacetylase family protein n=1 Tax=unclassified Paenibacillus TaxID=185978 RepID=UPI001E5DB1FD|nr:MULTISPECIES: polysaccharide deacetylase family protein [unclassified Paenibacillus]CAH0119861.1 hypothetical protein PAE9249_02369 [Paenibacillus sp. CECT 9249]